MEISSLKGNNGVLAATVYNHEGGSLELKSILSKGIESVRVTTNGRMESDVVLTVGDLTIQGRISGNEFSKAADVQKAYNFFSYLETLQLPESTIPFGRPPRGQTLFFLKYSTGEVVCLAMNPNSPEGQSYYELTPDQFQHLFGLWGDL